MYTCFVDLGTNELIMKVCVNFTDRAASGSTPLVSETYSLAVPNDGVDWHFLEYTHEEEITNGTITATRIRIHFITYI